jgi:hypothetical protein
LIGESLLDYRKETPEMGTVDIIQPLKNPSGEDCGEVKFITGINIDRFVTLNVVTD